jgi:5'-3' exonuclease
MGVKYFFKWLNTKFSSCLSSKFRKEIEFLMIDMNALYHSVAQKIYKYGEHKQLPRLIKPTKIIIPSDTEFYKGVCDEIETLINMVKPTKKVILCVDGVAPISKQNQQRLRRFKSSLEMGKNFDSNAISIGTKLMHNLSLYIDSFIKENVVTKYKELEFIFSSEKVPGEGEHKIISYIRNYHNDETCCIVSLDADLIMLLLATNKQNLSILRLMTDPCVVDIDILRVELVKHLGCNDFKNSNDFITDFVIICFFVGNDFLPNIPTMEILNDAIDVTIVEYKKNYEVNGHLTYRSNNNIKLNILSLKEFLKLLTEYETKFINQKIENKDSYFKDELLEKHINKNKEVNFSEYKDEYYKTKFNSQSIDFICHHYLSGLIWNINYYSIGVSDWSWYYPYHYGPFLIDLYKSLSTFKSFLLKKTKPNEPFKQLLSILPPSSSHLLPSCLQKTLDNELKSFCPSLFKIDISGKRQEWEGIVIIPFIDQQFLDTIYSKYSSLLTINELERNKLSKTFQYVFNNGKTTVKSFIL